MKILLFIIMIILNFNVNVNALNGYVSYNQIYNQSDKNLDQWVFELYVEKDFNLNKYGNLKIGGSNKTYNLDEIGDRFPISFYPKSLFYTAFVEYNYNNYSFRFESLCYHEFGQKPNSKKEGDWEENNFNLKRKLFFNKQNKGYIKATYRQRGSASRKIADGLFTKEIEKEVNDKLQFNFNLERENQLTINQYDLGKLTIGNTTSIYSLTDEDITDFDFYKNKFYLKYDINDIQLNSTIKNDFEEVNVGIKYKY